MSAEDLMQQLRNELAAENFDRDVVKVVLENLFTTEPQRDAAKAADQQLETIAMRRSRQSES